MVEDLEIQNFRCFEHVSLSGLKQINVIVGKNASGKTALLEAIFLAASDSPAMAFRFRIERGLGEEVLIARTRIAYEGLWKDLFFAFDQNKTIRVGLRGTRGSTRSVSASYSREESLALPVGEQPVEAANIRPIDFVYEVPDAAPYTIRPEITEKGFVIGGITPPLVGLFFSAPIIKRVGKETADNFSELSKEGKEAPIVEAIKEAFPFIESLGVETHAGRQLVHAKVRGIRRKLPIGLVSEGVEKLVTIFTGIAARPSAIVLVDEIESGVHYTVMEKVWSALVEFCRTRETQLFVSSHSKEAIQSIAPIMARHKDDFLLLRTERTNGQSIVKQFVGSAFLSAIEEEVEVR